MRSAAQMSLRKLELIGIRVDGDRNGDKERPASIRIDLIDQEEPQILQPAHGAVMSCRAESCDLLIGGRPSTGNAVGHIEHGSLFGELEQVGLHAAPAPIMLGQHSANGHWRSGGFALDRSEVSVNLLA